MTLPCASLYKYTPGSSGNWATFSRRSMKERLYLNYVMEMAADGASRHHGVRPADSGKEADHSARDTGAGAARRGHLACSERVFVQSSAGVKRTEDRELLLQ